MRSLAVKLTLAFLVVGITGALLVAVISGQRTRLEFDRFVDQQGDNAVLAVLLLGLYEENDSWEGIEQRLNSDRSLGFLSRRILLADSSQTIIYSPVPGQSGRDATDLDMGGGMPIVRDDERVGTVYIRSRVSPEGGGRPASPRRASFCAA